MRLNSIVLALLLLVGSANPSHAAGDSSAQPGKGPPPLQTASNAPATSPQATSGVREYDFETELTNEVKNLAGQFQDATPGAIGHHSVMLILTLLCAGLVAFVKFRPALAQLFAKPCDALAPAVACSEEQAYNEFAARFRAGPPPATLPSPTAPPSESGPWEIQTLPPATYNCENSVPAADLVQQFFAEAPKQLAAAQKMLLEIRRAQEPAQIRLRDLCAQITGLKDASSLPQLLPFWQMAVALEALLRYLQDKPEMVTASTVLTVANALDLLGACCIPGLKPNLATDPPFRLLAVDDDAISRHAISFALKKALNAPDLANDGPAAQTLAAQHTYDAIFLDIQMPGMNGFELCAKIRELEANRDTPVVFVTRHSEFESRARSVTSGGQDLIGKPFVIFEVALKALTLVLGNRLQKLRLADKPAPSDSSRGPSRGAHLLTGLKTPYKAVPTKCTVMDHI